MNTLRTLLAGPIPAAVLAAALLLAPISTILYCSSVGAADRAIAGGLMRGDSGLGELSPNTGEPMVTGKVVETMNAAGYTYVQVEADGEKIWAAGPTTSLSVDDTVSFRRGMTMKNFSSKTLGRTFDSIYFVEAIYKGRTRAEPAAKAPAAEGAESKGAPEQLTAKIDRADRIEISGIKKASGGKTVAELFDQAAELAGTDIVVRGKVVKANTAIMGKNWLHIRDGSASESGADDLTVATQAKASVGDTVLVRGTLQTDVSLGHGYHYEVIIEEAEVTVE